MYVNPNLKLTRNDKDLNLINNQKSSVWRATSKHQTVLMIVSPSHRKTILIQQIKQ